MRRTMPLLCLALIVGAAGCGGSGGNPASADRVTPEISVSSPLVVRPSESRPPPAGDRPGSTPATQKPAAPAFPTELVGRWISSSGGADIVYEFDADGSYRYAGVLLQKRPSGMFSFTVGEAGVALAVDDGLLLRPRKATKSLHDPDSPSSSYTNRPASLAPKRLAWSTSGSSEEVLTLDDGTGEPVDYQRK